MLPVENDKFWICDAIDTIDNQITEQSNSKLFKNKTNLPHSLRLQQGARVMYLNNNMIEKGICNGTVGVIADINHTQDLVRIVFCINGGIIDLEISKYTSKFYLNGSFASRTQFPLQNAFALTTHKTQSISLSSASISLDSEIFSPGQAYVALSRCTSWENLQIISFDKNAIITDQSMIQEYNRLKEKISIPLPL